MALWVWGSPSTDPAVRQVPEGPLWSVRRRWPTPSRPTLPSLCGRCWWDCRARPWVWPCAAPCRPSASTSSPSWRPKTSAATWRYSQIFKPSSLYFEWFRQCLTNNSHLGCTINHVLNTITLLAGMIKSSWCRWYWNFGCSCTCQIKPLLSSNHHGANTRLEGERASALFWPVKEKQISKFRHFKIKYCFKSSSHCSKIAHYYCNVSRAF